MTYYYTKDELYHHGILGQKWGKLNGPPYPLGVKDHSKSEQNAGWRKSLGGGRNEELYDRNEKKQSKDALNSKQKKQLTKQQKAILYGALGAAVGLGVGTAVYVTLKKHGVGYLTEDMTIKAGESIQRINKSNENGLHDVFYAAVNEHDKERYENTLPAHYLERGANSVVKREFTASNEIKIAGHKTAKKLFYELAREDPDFAVAALTRGIFGYDSMNKAAVLNHDPMYKEVYNKYFDKLKAAGYGGFLDINDQKYSGYGAKAPVILFNNNNFSLKNETVLAKDLHVNMLNRMGVAAKAQKEFNKAIPEHYFNQAVERIAPYSAIGGAYLGYKLSEKPPTNNQHANKNKKKRR